MKKDLFIINHAAFGREEFEIANAQYNLYQDGNIWEFVVSIETSSGIVRAEKLADVIDAKPNFEATAILQHDDLEIVKGKIIRQEVGYDNDRDEILSNVYYFQHESVDDLLIEIIEVNNLHIIANVTGKGIINGSNGNHPDADFEMREVAFLYDAKLKRGVM
jgi:hypothetical protein